MKRFLVWTFLSAALFVILLISLQRPWRPTGAIHVVSKTVASGVTIYVAQEHDGHGLNDTFIVAQADDQRWKWFPINHDDLQWFTVSFKELPRKSVRISKYGIIFGEFNPKTFTINIDGQTNYFWKETIEFPEQ